MIAPEEYDGSDCDGGHEEVGAPVVSCCDAAPVLKPVEGVFDFVALFVESLIECDGSLPARNGRDAGRDFHCLEGVAPLVAVISFVCDQGLGFGQGRIDDLRADMI